MLSFVILHSKRCLGYLILQFSTPSMQGHDKSCALAPSCPSLVPSCPRLVPSHALGIYVVICHFTFKKVSRIPHTTILKPQYARTWQVLRPRTQVLCPRTLGIYVSFVILHSKRCLEYLILQFPTPSMQRHEKACTLTPSRTLAPLSPLTPSRPLAPSRPMSHLVKLSLTDICFYSWLLISSLEP